MGEGTGALALSYQERGAPSRQGWGVRLGYNGFMKLGVHCSVRGGLTTGMEEAHRLGCDTLQIFTHSPRMWRVGALKPEDVAAFKKARATYGISPVVVHTPYLP